MTHGVVLSRHHDMPSLEEIISKEFWVLYKGSGWQFQNAWQWGRWFADGCSLSFYPIWPRREKSKGMWHCDINGQGNEKGAGASRQRLFIYTQVGHHIIPIFFHTTAAEVSKIILSPKNINICAHSTKHMTSNSNFRLVSMCSEPQSVGMWLTLECGLILALEQPTNHQSRVNNMCWWFEQV